VKRVGLVAGLLMFTHASAQPPPIPTPEPPPSPEPDAAPPPPVEDAAPAAEPAAEPSASEDVIEPPSADMIDPSQLPVEPAPVSSRYPRSFVERPLVLPRGVHEVVITGRVGRETVDDLYLEYALAQLGVRFGRGGYEVDAGFEVMVHDDHNFREELVLPLVRRIYAGISWQLSDTSIGVQGVLGNAGTRFQRYSPSLTVSHKLRPSERGAIILSGAADYNYGNQVGAGDVPFVTHRFGVYATATGRIQAGRFVALQLSGSAAYFQHADDHVMDSSYDQLSASAALLISISTTVDVSPYVSLGAAGELAIVTGGLVLSIR
jgi:hypothetical protein